jgi:hypothetical protein
LVNVATSVGDPDPEILTGSLIQTPEGVYYQSEKGDFFHSSIFSTLAFQQTMNNPNLTT